MLRRFLRRLPTHRQRRVLLMSRPFNIDHPLSIHLDYSIVLMMTILVLPSWFATMTGTMSRTRTLSVTFTVTMMPMGIKIKFFFLITEVLVGNRL